VVDALLRNAARNECELYMHKINVLEIYYGIFRELGQEKAEDVLKKISVLPIKLVNVLSERVFKEAGRLKATYYVSLADSLALAEAKVRKAQLVTSDHHEFDPLEVQKEITCYWIR